jgi:sec-independent protein translocase protein TatB
MSDLTDLGPEFEDLREPLSELQKVRGITPRAALTKHLLDGDDSTFTGKVRPAKAAVCPAADTPTRGRAAAAADHYGADAT